MASLHSGRCWSLVLALAFLVTRPVLGQDSDQQQEIDKAIGRGVAFLRSRIADEGVEDERNRIGMTALVAWTLLEAGARADDPLIEKAAHVLRRDLLGATNTYDLATALLFFDKLGHAADEPFIEGMAIRLLAGQSPQGGWGYHSRLTEKNDEIQLRAYLERSLQNWDRAKRRRGKSGRMPEELPDEVRPLLRAAEKPQALAYLPDGSNTQFAMLALWVARRHGVPVDEALLRTVRAFRRAQWANGPWDYYLAPAPKGAAGRGRVTMTCAGVLAIALEHGIAKKKKRTLPPLENDRAAVDGLKQVGRFLTGFDDPKIQPFLTNPTYFYYFLFSMERMAMVYDLKKIGDTDWYLWGVDKLLKSQQPGGQWTGLFGPADTCFALLFLKRANVARDLTLDLKGIIRQSR
jgi:hypothetical protein